MGRYSNEEFMASQLGDILNRYIINGAGKIVKTALLFGILAIYYGPVFASSCNFNAYDCNNITQIKNDPTLYKPNEYTQQAPNHLQPRYDQYDYQQLPPQQHVSHQNNSQRYSDHYASNVQQLSPAQQENERLKNVLISFKNWGWKAIPQQVYDAIKNYCEHAQKKLLFIDSHLVGQAIRRLASSNPEVINITEIVCYIVNSYDRMMWYSTHNTGSDLFNSLPTDFLQSTRGWPKKRILEFRARQDLQMFIESIAEDQDCMKNTAFITQLVESLIKICCEFDKNNVNGIDNRFSALLALPEGKQRDVPILCSRCGVFYGLNNKYQYNMLHAIMSASRKNNTKFYMSPFSIVDSVSHTEDSMLNFELRRTIGCDMQRNHNINNEYINNNALLYMLLLSIKDTPIFKFQENTVKTLINISANLTEVINRGIKEIKTHCINLEESEMTRELIHSVAKTFQPETLKYYIIEHELIIQLLYAQSGQIQNSPDMKSKIDKAISELQTANFLYIEAYEHLLNLAMGGLQDNNSLLISMLQELSASLRNLAGDGTLEEIEVLNSILEQKLPAQEQQLNGKHHRKSDLQQTGTKYNNTNHSGHTQAQTSDKIDTKQAPQTRQHPQDTARDKKQLGTVNPTNKPIQQHDDFRDDHNKVISVSTNGAQNQI